MAGPLFCQINYDQLSAAGIHVREHRGSQVQHACGSMGSDLTLDIAIRAQPTIANHSLTESLLQKEDRVELADVVFRVPPYWFPPPPQGRQ